jgi:arylsulfatase A-like enzyme
MHTIPALRPFVQLTLLAATTAVLLSGCRKSNASQPVVASLEKIALIEQSADLRALINAELTAGKKRIVLAFNRVGRGGCGIHSNSFQPGVRVAYLQSLRPRTGAVSSDRNRARPLAVQGLLDAPEPDRFLWPRCPCSLRHFPAARHVGEDQGDAYASTSYVDAQIGKVITALTELGLAENTIVVLWGDNGFHLGDLGIWTKHTNYEQANRIPLLITAPGVTSQGSVTRQPAESVDLFPTLTEIAGLPAPAGPQPIDGISLVPVLRDPAARIRDHAFHAYPKGKNLGRAIRTGRYRMVEWKPIGGPESQAEYELYDYQSDPLETRNLADEFPEVLQHHKAILATYPEAVR